MSETIRRTGSAAVIFGLALFLQGCLYSSHHFNTGRILAPGNTAVTIGYGHMNLNQADCREFEGWYAETDSLDVTRCVQWNRQPGDTAPRRTMKPEIVETSLPRFSLGYRLGVRGPWGPFTGVEMGWHLEAPTNPGSAEFDLKFGLPTAGAKRFFHTASGGWIVGMWSDNSFFGEYAASRAFGTGYDAHALYGSWRLTRLATQPDEVFVTDTTTGMPSFGTRRRWANQATVGFHVRLPAIPIIPDYLSPQATFSMPWVPVFESVRPEEDYLLNLNLGFGWRF
jgi:hypothetical protein